MTKLSHALRQRLRSASHSRIAHTLDTFWFACYAGIRRRATVQRASMALIATNGGGNIGDQAMLESAIKNFKGSIIVFVRTQRSFFVDPVWADRVRFVVTSGLFAGRPQVLPLATWRFARQLRACSSLAIIGADIVDGSYDQHEALARLRALRLAVRWGIPSRVLGFSWSPNADAAVTAGYQALEGKVDLISRDPASFARMESLHIPGVRQGADTAFLLFPSPQRRASELTAGGARTPQLILNVSGLLQSRSPNTQAYVAIATTAISLDWTVTLLPHVIRRGDDDRSAMREVVGRLPSGIAVDTVDELLSPAQVQRLVSRADLVITGRMHLGILALASLVPPLILGSQGKVEGLLSLFGLESHFLDPESEFDAVVTEHLRSLAKSPQRMSERLERALPAVRELAHSNFTELH